MRIFSNKQKANGELAMRGLNSKAATIYNDICPLEVFEYERDGMTLYAYSGVFGDREGMSFDELEKEFEELFEELEA